MKKGIHPKVNTSCKVTCACGNTFTTISTLEEIKVDICSACHPFYTGQQKFVDTEGRIDKFKKKMELAKAKKADPLSKKELKKAAKTGKTTPITLKDLLKEASVETTNE